MQVHECRCEQYYNIHTIPVQEVELLADQFLLNQNERGDVLRQLFMGRDNSRYGLMNAVTASSQLSDSYERATELESIGGEILAMSIPRRLLDGATSPAEMKNVTPMRKRRLVMA